MNSWPWSLCKKQQCCRYATSYEPVSGGAHSRSVFARNLNMHNKTKVELKDNKPQQIQMQRLIEGSFNDFDGEMVAKSLTDNPDLWDGFVFGRFGYAQLIELRDIGQGYLNADTMMILTTNDRLKELLALIETWNADDVRQVDLFANRLPNVDFGPDLEPNQVILQVCWDMDSARYQD